MGFAMSFILVLLARIFQFISFSLLFLAYFFKKSPQAFGVRVLAPVFCVSPHILTSGLLSRDGNNSSKTTFRFGQNGGGL